MKIFFGLITFIFLATGFYVARGLFKPDDPKVVKSYLESRGKKPIPASIRGEIGKGI